MIAVRTVVTVSMVLAAVAMPVSSPAFASPARRLARQGVMVVPVPTAAPAPAVVVPVPGALPIVASRPLRPWRKTLVQPVAVLVPVPGVPVVAAPIVAAPSPAEPAFSAPLAVDPQVNEPHVNEPRTAEPRPAEPRLVEPRPTPPTTPGVPTPATEQIPAPLPSAAGPAEPELLFGSP